MSQPLAFTVTFGVIPGYNEYKSLNELSPYDRDRTENRAEYVREAWQAAMESELKHSGISVSAVVGQDWTVYAREHGCFQNGEPTVTAYGNSNPRFTQDTAAYREAVIRVVKSVKDALRQKTVQLVFKRVDDFYYLTEDSK